MLQLQKTLIVKQQVCDSVCLPVCNQDSLSVATKLYVTANQRSAVCSPVALQPACLHTCWITNWNRCIIFCH